MRTAVIRNPLLSTWILLVAAVAATLWMMFP